jgi:AraC-like DNA-binding protein
VLGRNHLLLETSAPARAEEHLNRVFAYHRLDVPRGGGLRFQHRQAGAGELDVNHLVYGADVTISTPALPDFYLLQVTLKGACRITDGGAAVDLPAGSVFVMNPGRAYRKEWSEESEQLIVRIDRAVLERRVVQETGARRVVHFDFAPADPRSAASIARAMDYLCSDLGDPDGGLRDLGPRRCFSDLLLSLLLGRLRNDQRQRAASPAAPHYVRRAEEFIRGQAGEDIGLSDIAGAAGVNSRTLNAGFRRFRDTTPITFLRDVRLDQARRLLQAPNRWTTVTTAALACNLGHLGRFAQAYAERFGERPSETLRLAQQRARH